MHFTYKSAPIMDDISSEIFAKPTISTVSPRIFVSNPQFTRTRAAFSLSKTPNCELSAFTSVLRRWLNAARITRNISFSSPTSTGGFSRRRRRITLDVTFGCGTKQLGGTSNSSSGSAYHCTKIPPFPPERICAARPRAVSSR